MIETYTWSLVNYTNTLTALQERFEARLESVLRGDRDNTHLVDITAIDRNNLSLLIDEHLRPWLMAHSLTASYDHATRILDELIEEEPDIRTLISQLKHLNTIIEDELRRRMFLYVPPEGVSLYRTPLDMFPLGALAFPSARYDMEEACRCHALGRYTACVYHCMGILQCGLYALAADLQVAFSYSIELAEWSAVITSIETKIKPFREGPRSDKKDADLSFYSECASQFRYFKDAWRNHVGHSREVYDRDQAHSALIHVRDFIEKRSLRIKELA